MALAQLPPIHDKRIAFGMNLNLGAAARALLGSAVAPPPADRPSACLLALGGECTVIQMQPPPPVLDAAAAAAVPAPVSPGLQALPVELLCRLLRHVDAPSLLALAQTCRSLRAVADSDAVWRPVLLADMRRWRVLCKATLPGHHALFCRVKQTFLSCSPHSRSPLRRAPASPTASAHGQSATGAGLTLSALRVRALLLRAPPTKIVIFGPGLEQSGAPLVYEMFHSELSPFEAVGMIQGNGGGGGGVALRHKSSGLLVNMVALYHRRQRAVGDLRCPASSVEACRDAGAFICVVDDGMLHSERAVPAAPAPTAAARPGGNDDRAANTDQRGGLGAGATHRAFAETELGQLLPTQGPAGTAPLLVATCSAGFQSGRAAMVRRAGAVGVASQLGLGPQHRDWRVDTLSLGSELTSMRPAFDWLLERALR